MNHTLSNTVFSRDAPGAIASFHEGPKNVATWLAANVIPFYLFSFLTWQIMHWFPYAGRHGERVHHASSALCSLKWKWPLAEFSVTRRSRHFSFILQKKNGNLEVKWICQDTFLFWFYLNPETYCDETSATEMFTQMCMKVLQPPGVSLYIFRL